MDFDFYLPTKLVTGNRPVVTHSGLMKNLGDTCLIITSGTAGEKSGALKDVKEALAFENIAYEIWNTVEQNPLLEDAFRAGEKAKEMGADFIVGIGGGSPLDASKTVAVYGANDLELMEIYDYKWEKVLPIIAIGTTAGTGSEVTQYAVMTTPNGLKQSVSHPGCFPTIAYGDPVYTQTLSLDFTIATALDALSHAAEGYYSTAAGGISDVFALEAVEVLVPSLKALKSLENGEEITLALREDLYFASVSAGFTLALCGTTYCHTLGYFLSEEHNIPHGKACAVFLPGFISRQAALLPVKKKALEKTIGISTRELGLLIEDLVGSIPITLAPEEIDKLVNRGKDSANFKKTAPSGLSVGEATKIMTELFSTK